MAKKSKKKKIILISLTVFVLVAVGVVTTILLNHKSSDQVNAEKIVTDFLVAYHNKDTAAGKYLLSGSFSSSDLSFDGLQGTLAEQLTFKITGSNVDKENTDQVIVNVTITNVDVASVLRPLEQTNESDTNQLMESIIEKLTSASAPKKSFPCTFLVERFPNGLKIQLSQNSSNALLGGYNEYLSTLTQSEASK